MKKKIWIWNHYATNMLNDKAGRHYWFSENLIRNGYEPTIFCASTLHNSGKNISIKNQIFTVEQSGEFPFVIVKTPQYLKNGIKRIINMTWFYKNLFPVAKKYAKDKGKPDVILTSSVHPLTLVAGIKIAKKFNIPCIVEVRDLWPESIIAYGELKKDSLLARILYRGERWIYKNADSIIMTWEGGAQYINDNGWEDIDLNKVHHISNGIIIDSFDKNSVKNIIEDSDLDDKNYKNLVYTGSIRKVNNLGVLIDSAKIVQKHDSSIRFLIYGDGDEKELLQKRCQDESISNIIFKGRVDKKMIPSILKKSYANILHNSSTSLDKYGQSQNKFFEYLAAGKCVIQTYTTNYSILETCHCGVSAPKQIPEIISNLILNVCQDDEEVKKMGLNARKAAYNFDFKKLTEKLIDIVENL